jgi:predicted O-methyltransferase YrrM
MLKNSIAHIIAFIFPSRVAKDKKYFRLWEKKGFHITPVHFYEPIPDTTTLKDDLWRKQSELVGININEKQQIKLLSLFSSRYKKEYDSLPRNKTTNQYQYYVNNKEFGSVDGEILYCMNRHFKPKRIVEIGSGYSTLLSAQAVLKNREEDSSYECEFVAIEPHPKKGLPRSLEIIH